MQNLVTHWVKQKKDNYGIFLPLYRTKLQLSHKVRIFFQNSIFGYQEEGQYSYLDIFHIKIHLLVLILYLAGKKREARENPI